MSRKRWHLLGLFTAVGAIAVGLVTVPASAAGGVGAAFTKGSDWGTGYEGKYTISNGSGATLPSWTVEFDLPSGAKISSLWDG
uniref:cellulose binding domain-containing protein n=1 Tax=Amycolatopsis kentuckyensis TaxID=218823 RepID=UPI001ABF7A1B